jgi:hypothetical protein
MMAPRLVALCAVFAALMGFVIGASYFAPADLLNPETKKYETAKKTEAASAEPQAENSELARYTFWLVVITGGLAIATVGLGAATLGLYLIGERQIKVAQKSVEIADKTLVSTQRPWISFDVEITGDLERANGLPLKIQLKNTGPTPASIVDVRAYLYYEDQFPAKVIKKIADTIATQDGRGRVIFPDETIEVTDESGVWTCQAEETPERSWLVVVAKYGIAFEKNESMADRRVTGYVYLTCSP